MSCGGQRRARCGWPACSRATPWRTPTPPPMSSFTRRPRRPPARSSRRRWRQDSPWSASAPAAPGGWWRKGAPASGPTRREMGWARCSRLPSARPTFPPWARRLGGRWRGAAGRRRSTRCSRTTLRSCAARAIGPRREPPEPRGSEDRLTAGFGPALWAGRGDGVALAHGVEAAAGVVVQPLAVGGDERDHHLAKVVAAGHPLVVVAPAVVVGAVEPPAWEGSGQPSEQLLVADVHPQGDLRLAPVTAEVSLPDEQAEQIAHGEAVELRSGGGHRVAGYRASQGS